MNFCKGVLLFSFILFLFISCTGKKNQLPTAAFILTPESGYVPLKVNFDASNSSDLDGTINNYKWNFGNEQTGEGKITEHNFTEVGEYKVVLTVVDDDGGKYSTEKTLTVSTNTIPIASNQELTAEQDTAIEIELEAKDIENDNLTFAIVASTENGTITGTPPNLTYKPNVGFVGIDSLTFKVNDTYNDSNTATVSITVLDELEPNNNFEQAKTLTLGKVTRSFINPLADIDWYKFSLVEESIIVVSVKARELGSELDSFILLFDEGEKLIATDDNNADDTVDSLIQANLAAGNYFVVVQDTSQVNQASLAQQLIKTSQVSVTENLSGHLYELVVSVVNTAPNAKNLEVNTSHKTTTRGGGLFC